MQNFKEYVFKRTPPANCFSIFYRCLFRWFGVAVSRNYSPVSCLDLSIVCWQLRKRWHNLTMIEWCHCTGQKHSIVAGNNYLHWKREICMEAEILISEKNISEKKELRQIIWLVLHMLKTSQIATKIGFILGSSEVCSELFQTSKMEHFVKIVNWKLLTILKNSPPKNFDRVLNTHL